jgi:hypothetical protein
VKGVFLLRSSLHAPPLNTPSSRVAPRVPRAAAVVAPLPLRTRSNLRPRQTHPSPCGHRTPQFAPSSRGRGAARSRSLTPSPEMRPGQKQNQPRSRSTGPRAKRKRAAAPGPLPRKTGGDDARERRVFQGSPPRPLAGQERSGRKVSPDLTLGETIEPWPTWSAIAQRQS